MEIGYAILVLGMLVAAAVGVVIGNVMRKKMTDSSTAKAEEQATRVL